MLEDVVGVFGGTFDPTHFGHLRPALELHEQLGLTRLLMVPSAVPPHREQPLATVEQRLAMLRLAVADEPALEIDTREIDRNGPSYMVDTLASLRQELGEGRALCLCLGVDAFLGLPGWHRWHQIFELAHIVVAHRPGWELASHRVTEALQTQLTTRLRSEGAALREQPAGNIVLQQVTQLAISATEIRARIRAGGSARYLLPDAVWHYIQQQKLYR